MVKIKIFFSVEYIIFIFLDFLCITKCINICGFITFSNSKFLSKLYHYARNIGKKTQDQLYTSFKINQNVLMKLKCHF